MRETKPCTLDSLDDDLWTRKNNEIKEMQAKIDDLYARLGSMTDAKKKWNDKFNNLLTDYRKLEQENREMSKKLLLYEHDPIKMDVTEEGVDIEYWNEELNQYKLLATFYNNDLEKDLEEFCREFIIELKEAYLVE